MRITGGAMRGRVLAGKVGAGVRPTKSRVREAMFSMVGQELDGWTVLDAFGGSGILGFEALSRGAESLTVCELNRAAAYQIRASAAGLKLTVDVRTRDAALVLESGSWDLVLLDPPYDADALEWAERAAPAVRQLLVVEHRPGVAWPKQIGSLVLEKVRRHGDSALAFYRTGELAGAEEGAVVVQDLGVVEDDGCG
jgi:16S rRNA (guanine966-N2)-methyltransferase